MQTFQFLHPQSRHCVRRHPPVAPGGQGDGAHLGAVGQAGALELLGKEPAVEVVQATSKSWPGHTGRPGRTPPDGTPSWGRSPTGWRSTGRSRGAHRAPTRSSVLWLILPPTAGSSSGETGVSRMSSSTADSLGSSLPLSSETKDTRWRTQGLGDAGVHRVHGHVVPVVGGPAQGQLGQVAGADDHAARLVGDVHEHLGVRSRAWPFSKVTEWSSMDWPMSLKWTFTALADVDALQGGPQALSASSMALSRVRSGGAEAGHGHRDDVAGRTVQQLHGHCGNQNGQGGVQGRRTGPLRRSWPGCAPGAWSGPGRRFSESRCTAPPGPPRPQARRGWGENIPGELGLAQLQLEIVGVGILSPGGEGGHAPGAHKPAGPHRSR